MSDYFDPHVICFRSEGFNRLEKHGCVFHSLPSGYQFVFRLLTYYSMVPYLLGKLCLKKSQSVLIAQGPYEAMSVLPVKVLLKPFAAVYLVIEAHGDWIESFLELRSIPSFLKSFVRWMLETLSSFVLFWANGYRSVSNSTKRMLNQYGRSVLPHHTFPAYMDLDPFFEANERDHSPSMPVEGPYIMYAGALTELKGVDLLIKAFRILAHNRKLKLVLCGTGPDREAFEKLADSEGVRDQTTFTGFLPRKQLAVFMAQAELFVLPSRSEGYGRVLIESMASGTAVVASATGGAREIINQSSGGITVPVNDVEGLADGIKKLLDNKQERESLSTRGHEYVMKHYSGDYFFEGYQALISDMIPDRVPHS